MGRGRGATPRSARPRAGVDGSPAPRFLGGIAAPGCRHTSSRSPWGGRSSAHPTACATFCFWRGKGGACERRSWRGGATLSPLRSPRRFAAHLDYHWCAKFRTNHARVKPISRAAPITGSVSRSVDSWRPLSQTTSLPKNELKGYRASLGSHPTQGRKNIG